MRGDGQESADVEGCEVTELLIPLVLALAAVIGAAALIRWIFRDDRCQCGRNAKQLAKSGPCETCPWAGKG